jgi:hypothetical protein
MRKPFSFSFSFVIFTKSTANAGCCFGHHYPSEFCRHYLAHKCTLRIQNKRSLYMALCKEAFHLERSFRNSETQLFYQRHNPLLFGQVRAADHSFQVGAFGAEGMASGNCKAVMDLDVDAIPLRAAY